MKKSILFLMAVMAILFVIPFCYADGYQPANQPMLPEAQILDYVQDMVGYRPSVAYYDAEENIFCYFMYGDNVLRFEAAWDNEGNLYLMSPKEVMHSEDWESMSLIGFSSRADWYQNRRWVPVQSLIDFMELYNWQVDFKDSRLLGQADWTNAAPLHDDIPTRMVDGEPYIPETSACDFAYSCLVAWPYFE